MMLRVPYKGDNLNGIVRKYNKTGYPEILVDCSSEINNGAFPKEAMLDLDSLQNHYASNRPNFNK